MAKEKDTPAVDSALAEDYADEATPDPGGAERAARAAAIRELRDRGYMSGKERRPVRSDAHAEFLIRAGTVEI